MISLNFVPKMVSYIRELPLHAKRKNHTITNLVNAMLDTAGYLRCGEGILFQG